MTIEEQWQLRKKLQRYEEIEMTLLRLDSAMRIANPQFFRGSGWNHGGESDCKDAYCVIREMAQSGKGKTIQDFIRAHKKRLIKEKSEL